MNVAAAIGMYERRASVIGWRHARPADPSRIDPLTQGPRISIGGPTPDGYETGPFGETYYPEFKIRAYATGKISSTLLAQYGMVEAGDMEICALVPFRPDPTAGIFDIPDHLLAAYNAGRFAQVAKSKTLAAFDRFDFFGQLFAAKAVPVPIVDGTVILGWRILITKVTI